MRVPGPQRLRTLLLYLLFLSLILSFFPRPYWSSAQLAKSQVVPLAFGWLSTSPIACLMRSSVGWKSLLIASVLSRSIPCDDQQISRLPCLRITLSTLPLYTHNIILARTSDVERVGRGRAGVKNEEGGRAPWFNCWVIDAPGGQAQRHPKIR